MSKINKILEAILTFEDAAKQLDTAKKLHRAAVTATTVFGASTVVLSTIHINNYIEKVNAQEPSIIEQSEPVISEPTKSAIGSVAFLHIGVNDSEVDNHTTLLNQVTPNQDSKPTTLNRLNWYYTDDFNIYPTDSLPDISPKSDVDVYSYYWTKQGQYEAVFDNPDDYHASEYRLDEILNRNNDHSTDYILTDNYNELTDVAEGFTLVYEVSEPLTLEELFNLDDNLVGYLNTDEGTQNSGSIHFANRIKINKFIESNVTVNPCGIDDIDSSKNYLIVTVDNYAFAVEGHGATFAGSDAHFVDDVDYQSMEDAYLSVGYRIAD